MVDAFSNSRKDASERRQSLVFRFIAGRSPHGVILVLLSASCISSSRLDVPIGVGRNPYIGPSGWDHERPYSAERFGIADDLIPGIAVANAFAALNTSDTRCLIVDIHQVEVPGRFLVGGWNGPDCFRRSRHDPGAVGYRATRLVVDRASITIAVDLSAITITRSIARRSSSLTRRPLRVMRAPGGTSNIFVPAALVCTTICEVPTPIT